MSSISQDEALVKLLLDIDEYNAEIDRDREAKRAKPMTYTKPQQPAQPALPTPAAEPASTPRPEATKPQPVKRHNQPMPGRKVNPDGLAIQQRYLSGELDPLHAWMACEELVDATWRHFPDNDTVERALWVCHGAVRDGLHGELLGWKDEQARMAWVHSLEHMLELDKPQPKRKYMEDLPEYGDPNVRIAITPGGFKVVPIEPTPKFALPFEIPHLEVQRYIDPATTDLWEQIELIALGEICCKMYSGGQSGSGDGLSLAPHRCGRCPACIAHKAEQIQWRLRRMAQAGPIYGKIVSEAEHDKLVRKYGKRSTFSAPLADGLRWTVVNTQFDGGQQLDSEFTAEVVRREVKDWLNKLVRNVPEGKRLANLDLAGDKAERIAVHRFSVTDQYKPQAERLYSEAERETGLDKPTTREEAQARVKAAWPIFEAKARKAGVPLLNVREGWAKCDLISEGDMSDLRLSDEPPAERLARLTATGQMPEDSGNCPF